MLHAPFPGAGGHVHYIELDQFIGERYLITVQEQEWHEFLSGTHPHLHDKSPLRFIPSNPRCKLCSAPFKGPGGVVLRRYGYTPWEKNPNICGRCFKGLRVRQDAPEVSEEDEISGAEVEVSMLFADVRGSSKLARQMPVWDFTRLMNRFYRVSSKVLIDADAIIEKFVGDEVVGLFLPFLAGKDHARRAVEAADELLRATGHDSAEGPWVPLGAGVQRVRRSSGSSVLMARATSPHSETPSTSPHTSRRRRRSARSSSRMKPRRRLDPSGRTERRHVSLKGHPIDALVLAMSGGP